MRRVPCGLDGTTGRAPNLFNDQLPRNLSDQQMTQIIRHGIPGTEMAAFSPDSVTDQQLFQLLAFIRTESGVIKPKVQFVADPDGKVISSEKQKFKIEVVVRNLATPLGNGLFAGWPPADSPGTIIRFVPVT
jgi:hypothetical protein